MSKKMFSRERERGKLRFSALLILIGLLLFGCDPTMVTITYNANGGEGEMKPQAVESGVEVKLIANTFTKDGSDFTGWNEAADGSGKAYADGATVTPTGNLTLYAQWQVKSTPENPGTEDPGTEDPDPEQPGDGESDVDLQLTAGTAVFDAERGLKLSFAVGNLEALTEEELTELLTSATKTVTLFTADDETGTPVEDSHISHGVDTAADVSTPYILVAAAAFQSEPESAATYSIEVVLQAEGYVTQTLTYAEVSVNSEPETFGISEGEASYHADTGLTLKLTLTEGWSWPEGLDVAVSVQEGDADTTAELNKEANTIVLESSAVTEGTNTYTATLSAFGYTDLQLSWANVEIDKTAPLQILGVSFDRTAAGTSVTANWTLPEGHDIVKVVFTELVGNGNTSSDTVNASHVTDKEGGIVAEFPITGANETSGIIDNLTANAPYWFMVHTEDAAGNKSVRARDSVAGHVAPDDNGFMVRFTSSELNTGAPYITNATGYFDGTHYIFSWDNPNGYDVKIAKKGANLALGESDGSSEGIVDWITDETDSNKKIGAKVKLGEVTNSYNFRLMVYATDSDVASVNTPDTTNDFQAFCLFYFPENQANEVTPAN